MKITEFVKKLEAIKKKSGDLEVFVDLKNVIDNGGHDEYTHEESIKFKVQKINMVDENFCIIKNSKRSVLSLGLV